LSQALAGSMTRYTIIRAPLVYGPGIKANLRQLARATLSGWPLPFGCVDNRRSLLAVDNLADLLVHAARHPAAADRVFLAADGADLSTPELIRRIARAGGCKARLIPVPPSLIAWTLHGAGRGAMASKLLDSLRIDSSRVRQELDWAPRVSTDTALTAMVADLQNRDRLARNHPGFLLSPW
jgi:nucleoside-diphosphate-sugar epimerase